MRAWGYEQVEEDDDVNKTLRPLREVTVSGSPDDLRRLAEFLRFAADRKEACGTDFGHEHLSFWLRE